jgi:hypothetical protein
LSGYDSVVAFLRRLRFARQVALKPAPIEPKVLFSWAPGPFLPGGKYVGTAWNTARVTRDEALSVVGVKRGRDLLCSIATLPLETVGPDRAVVRSPLLEQIDPNVPNVVTLAMTLEDLIFDSVSWWQVTRLGWDGFPVEARHVDLSAVSMTAPPGYPIHTLPSGAFPNGVVWVMGNPVDGGNMVRFDSPNGPLLVHGARAVRRALKLAQTAEMYADDPEARAYWAPEDGVDPDDDIVKKALDSYAAARRERAEAYISAGMKRVPIQSSSPVDLQLVEQQKRSDLEIANLMGLDPEDLGISTTTRTYSNATDRRQDRLNNVLTPFMRAVTDRLSMNDITKRGYRVRFNLNDYMKADPTTRWATYGVALDKGVKSVQEVRAAEDLPDIPVEPRPVSAPTPATQAASAAVQASTVPTQNGVPVRKNTMPVTVHFADDSGPEDRQQFSFDVPMAFAVDTAKRTITGDILPYEVVGQNWSGKWRFKPGSLEWNASAVSRVKLNDEHYGPAFGAATILKDTPTAMTGSFKVGRSNFGTEQLMSAEDGIKDGLSAEVRILEYSVDETGGEPVNVVSKAKLTGVALTANPAFDDARVTKVAASRTTAPPTEGNTAMPCTTCGQVHAAGTPCPVQAPTLALSVDRFTTAVEAFTTAAQAPTPGVEQLTTAVDAFTAAVQALGQMPAEHRATVPAARPGEGVQSEPLIYSLNGLGESFVRDAWNARRAPYGSTLADEAQARLRKYGEQTADYAAQASQRFANAGNTTDQAQLLPPGYRPDLYVGQVPQGRPLFDSIGTKVMLANANPFKVPVWVGSANLSGTNSEGTGPSTGTITDHTYRTVSPTAQSGEFVVTRELMDSSNPVIDLIAMNAMREEYSQDTEAVIATALAAATDNDTGSGQSTEGCYVYAVTGTGNDLAIDGVREMSADFGAHRFIEPDTLLAGPTGFKALSKAVDDIGRPLFPYLSGQNAMGAYGRARRVMDVDGFAVPNVWSMTSTYDDLVMFTAVDMLAGESPLLTFRFEEKSGPENIVLNIWGYFCYQILRYTGIHACNYSAV